MPGENLTRNEAQERRSVIDTQSYEVSLDLTKGAEVFGSRSVVRFTATPGSYTFIDLIAKDVREITLNGEQIDPGEATRFWAGIREQADPFFADGTPLWRLSVKPTTPPLALPDKQLIEWGGALRWLKGGADAKAIRDAATRAGGHATLFRSADKSAGAFQPLAPALMKLHANLKNALDPAGVLKPGRLYPDL